MNKRMTLIYLHHMRSMTRKLLATICNDDTYIQSIFSYTLSDLKQQFFLDTSRATRIYAELHAKETMVQVETSLKKCVVITIFDQQYPDYLKQIPDPPLVLYLRGNLKLLNWQPSISVIGTRRPSALAYEKVKYILSPLIESGWIITSGFALGVDSYAHRLALQLGGPTIAVLGSGFDVIYPKQHTFLFDQIACKGLLLSEYPPHIRPQKYHFPERNRIISGISLATLVIEAQLRSGTMITVDQALEQGKDVYAVPGGIFEIEATGCNKLIQEGAKPVVAAEDILTEWQHMYDNKE